MLTNASFFLVEEVPCLTALLPVTFCTVMWRQLTPVPGGQYRNEQRSRTLLLRKNHASRTQFHWRWAGVPWNIRIGKYQNYSEISCKKYGNCSLKCFVSKLSLVEKLLCPQMSIYTCMKRFILCPKVWKKLPGSKISCMKYRNSSEISWFRYFIGLQHWCELSSILPLVSAWCISLFCICP